MPAAGRVVLAGTPIGDPADAPPRLAALLASAEVVAAEDTRRLRRLCSVLGVRVTGRLLSYHEHNETSRTAELVQAALAGATVLVVTDAGMPSVSDPGYRLVRAAVDAGVPVTSVPGPSAVLTALAVSGLPSDRFCFEGFLPRKPGERARALAALVTERRTIVAFEAPQRTAATLEALAAALGGDRPAAVCRELTKTYEEVVRGPLSELAAWASQRDVLGEVTLVVGGAPASLPSVGDLVGEVLARTGGGERLKDAVAGVAEVTGVPKRELYAAALVARAATRDVRATGADPRSP